MSSDREFARFEAETSHLRDSMLSAFSSNQYAAVDDALGVYRTLLSDLVGHYIAARENEADDALDIRQLGASAGREWELLLRHLYDLAESFSRHTPARVWSDFCQFLVDISSDAIDLGSTQSLRAYWGVATAAWRNTLHEPGDQSARHQVVLLDSVRTLAMIARSERNQWPQVRVEIAGFFVQLIKSAIDADAEAAAMQGVDYLDTTFRFDEGSSARRSSSGPDGLVAAAKVACCAWVLFRADVRGKPDLPRLRDHLTGSVDPWSAWLGLESLRRDTYEAAFSLTWWEIELRGGVGGGFMVLGSYQAIAAMIMGAAPSSFGDLEDVDFDQAAALKVTASQVVEGAYPGVSALVEGLRASAASTLGLMEEIVAIGERTREFRLRQSELEPARVADFASAAVAEMRSQRASGLARIFEERRSGVGLGNSLGFNGRISKSFFVTQPGVYADPGSLAESIVRAISAREEDVILDQIRTMADASIDDVAGFAAANAHRDDGEARSWCVVTNDWEVASRVSSDFGNTSRLSAGSVQGVPVSVFQSYSDAEAFSYLVDTASIVVARAASLGTQRGDLLDEDLALAISVSPDDLTVEGGEEAGTAVGTSALAIVRVLESFSVEAGADPLAVVLHSL